MLNLKRVNNKVQIFFQKSFKNTDRNKIEHDRPEISAGPGRTVRPSPARGFTTLLITTRREYELGPGIGAGIPGWDSPDI